MHHFIEHLLKSRQSHILSVNVFEGFTQDNVNVELAVTQHADLSSGSLAFLPVSVKRVQLREAVATVCKGAELTKVHLLSAFKFKVTGLAVGHLLALLVRLPNKKDRVVVNIQMLVALHDELLGLKQECFHVINCFASCFCLDCYLFFSMGLLKSLVEGII